MENQNQPQNQNPVQQPVQHPVQQPIHKNVSTGDWFATLFIAALPLIGLILLFVWAFGNSTSPCKANWAKATLLWYLVFLVLGMFFLILGAAIVGNIFSELF